jgi:anti-anti-sigma regulatory factor
MLRKLLKMISGCCLQANANRELSNEMDTLMQSAQPNAVPKEPFCLILDMSAVCFVDPSAMKALLNLYDDFKQKSLFFCLAATAGL